eukprot:scaffold1278_cov156-Skeletonema_menzelii.AAC.2
MMRLLRKMFSEVCHDIPKEDQQASRRMAELAAMATLQSVSPDDWTLDCFFEYSHGIVVNVDNCR